MNITMVLTVFNSQGGALIFSRYIALGLALLSSILFWVSRSRTIDYFWGLGIFVDVFMGSVLDWTIIDYI